MDHDQIEQEQIIDLYLMGRLEPEMTTRFEEHYFHCQDCLDQLELAEKLRRGLKRVAATEALERTATRQLAVLAWLARMSRSGQLGVLMTALLVTISLPTGMLFHQSGQRESEIGEVRSTLEQTRSQLADTRQRQRESQEALEKGKRASRAELAAERQRFEQELEREKKIREAAEARLARARAPRKNLPIFTLSAERSAGFEGEPSLRIRLTPADERIVLQLELDRPAYPSYRAMLLRGRDRAWRGGGLLLNHLDSLVLDFPATMLEAGDYRFSVEGVPPSGEPVAVAHFTFRVDSEP